MTRVVPCLVVLGSLWAGPAARAAGDYAVDDPGWTGLTELARLAGTAGFTVVAPADLDWQEVGDNDVIFVIYPRVPVEPAHVKAFVRRGGRMLIADDFGRATEALAALPGNLLRRPAQGVKAERFHDDNPALPVALARDPAHPLARGVPAIVTNHPAIFRFAAGADVVFGFAKDEAVVVAGALGEGRFVALSDPSVLINGMLVAIPEDYLFAARLVTYLAPRHPDRPSRLILLTGEFRLAGEPPSTLDDPEKAGSVNEILGDFGKFLDELNDYLAGEEVLFGLGIVAAAVLVILAGFVILPTHGRGRDLDGSWTRARAVEDRVDFERVVSWYDDARAASSFAYPAAVLRESTEARLAELVGMAEPMLLPARELVARVVQRAGGAAGHAAAALRDRLLATPTRGQAQATWGARYVSRREFEQLHDLCRAFEWALASEKGVPQLEQR